MAMRMLRGSKRLILLTISVNTGGYNLYTAAGSPTDAGGVEVRVTVNGGVLVFGTNQTPAFDTGTGWPGGSLLTLTNNGSIIGRGGNGANGVQSADGNAAVARMGVGGATDALNLQYPLQVNNTSGLVAGGGGGGGGGPGYGPTGSAKAGGGGGGGGRPSGTGGNASSAPFPGAAGNAATIGGAGTGGAGGIDSTFLTEGGPGGTGGDYGVGGSNGGPTVPAQRIGGAGGTPGRAATTNGHALTWLGGFNGTQVKGAVV